MNPNPLHWQRALAHLGKLDTGGSGSDGLPMWSVPDVGVPIPGAPCPPEVRVPLRAVLRQAFLAGNREAPLVDALAEVEGWETELDRQPHVQSGNWSAQVIIPVRGAHDALRLCLSCLATSEMTKAHVALVCAEAEAQAVRIAVHERALHFDVYTSPAPQSFARNCNLGASRSRSEFLVLLNSDAFVGPGWLDALLAPFADPDVVAVGPMGTNVSGIQFSWIVTHGDGPMSVESVAETVRTHRRGGVGIPGGPPGEPVPVRRLVGFCLAVRRTAWDRVGGLDEGLVNSHEDDSLCLKLSLVGKCVVVPDLLVLHAGSASFAELPDASENYNRTLAENRRRFEDRFGWILPDWNQWMDERGWR